ncbi:Isochorismatase hydrolase [Hypoxylon fragiforme]|uniref:Isochorismatase hydrolase n=1 Tax=Hypoxylon fragiforme TaxID=63214 RepID=UPI0020C5E3FB|nr:Isochorismatase hydrolase [Hypoxylon fragiforme]KAI2614799.1 Isochorismatase hydrolase [Hypoxylon fragiforme]
MKHINDAKTALLVIDVQNGFLDRVSPEIRSTPECEDNIALLLQKAREHNQNETSNTVVICHIHHHSIYPDSPFYPGYRLEVNGQTLLGLQPQAFAEPKSGEKVFTKDVNSSFIGTGLEAYLRGQGVRQLLIVGLSTDHCVSTTTRMANNLRVVSVTGPSGELDEGDIILVGDACATFAKGGFDAETVHKVNLASLHEEFAQVRTTQDVLDKVFGRD